MEFHCCVLPPRRPERMTEFALLAEELGFDRFWIADQTFHADPFLLLHHAAQSTTMPLGLAVTNPFSRHPVQIARSAATLSHLRPQNDWIVGLGAANPHHVLSPMGINLRNSAEQISAALDCIRQLLDGETVTFSSPRADFELHEVSLDIEAPPGVKLYIGTRGPLTLQQGGAIADGFIVEALFKPEMVHWARQQIANGIPSDLRDQSDTDYVAWQVTQVLDPSEDLPDGAVEFATMLMRSTSTTVLEMLDFPSDLIKDLKTGRDVQVPPAHIKQFVAAGTGDEVQEMVRAADGAGADAWSCVFTGDEGVAAASMRRFAHEVMNPLRATAD